MYYSDYSLRQLLELALRVPEVGAVNFNILYYVLKTVIKKMGLEGVKPTFSLDDSLNEEYKEDILPSEEVQIKKSHSAELLLSTTRKKTPNLFVKRKDASKSKTHEDTESARWDAIKFSKRILTVEEEINEIHALIAQFINRIANFERILKQQEMKFVKEVTDMKHSMVKSKNEDQSSIEKLEKLASDVSMLKDLNYDEEESAEKDKSDTEELVKGSEEAVRESRVPMKEEELGEESKEKISALTIPMEEEKESIEYSRQSFSEKLEIVFKELDSIKKHLKKESYYDDSKAHKKTPEKRKPEPKHFVTQSDISKIEVEMLNISLEVNKLMEKSSAIDKKLQSELGSIHEKIFLLEKSTTQCEEEMRFFQTNWNETLINFEYMKENLRSIEKQMAVLTEFPGLRHRVGQLEMKKEENKSVLLVQHILVPLFLQIN